MDSKFDLDHIISDSKNMSKDVIVPYEDLPQYDLFISQVIDYLNDKFKGESYTNNIVQNYVKSGVIAKPEDGKKRGYTKVHLAQLVMLSYMRPILTAEEMKKVFTLAFNNINDRSDDIISWEKAYKIFSSIQEDSFDVICSEYFNKEKLKKIMENFNLEQKDKNRVEVFFLVMTLLAQAAAIKKFVQTVVDNYDENS
ncbi:MAG: DUF1836 domain-containing protein [Bacillota bacterium]|nr:DUF1836 domain-containing protein [Bacillota bacterium]